MRIGVIAGEASGDLLGAGLIRELKARQPDVHVEGVAGEAMQAEGCELLGNADELSVMGLVEPLRRLPRLLALRRRLVTHWRRFPPDAFVGIDAPDFNLGVERRLRAAGTRTVHYVSPTVWAWRPGRVKTIRKAVDRVLCLFPFEKSFYDEQGIDAVFVGHPKASQLSAEYDQAEVRRALGVPPAEYYVAVLPGSRLSEVGQLAAPFADAAAKIGEHHPHVRFLVPVAASALEAEVTSRFEAAGIMERVSFFRGQSLDVMRSADVVLQASGTAVLEAALLGRPAVAAYRVAASTAWLVRSLGLLNVEHITLPNLLLDDAVVPEFVQEAVTGTRLADEVNALLDDAARRASIRQRFMTLRERLAQNADARAADGVLEIATRR